MWCSRYNKIPLALQEEALNSPNQFTCDQYYESICGYLLQGNLQAASELLRVHPEYAYGSGTPITKLHQVIVQKPTYSEYTHAPFVEFENAFRIWQSNVDDLRTGYTKNYFDIKFMFDNKIIFDNFFFDNCFFYF